jgi:phosphatidylglycerophosphatase B/undecaprenyl-diphosphatase
MPYHLLFSGFLLLFFSILILNIPTLSHLDLLSVEYLSQQRTVNLNQFTRGLSVLGGMPFVLFFTTLCCFILAWYKKYSKILFISLGLIGSIACAWLLKYLIARPRPPEIYHLVDSYGSSFPSAHSLYAASLAALILLVSQQHRCRAFIGMCALFWLVLMGISRVYLGVHYPSDVIAGWGISFIWIAILYLLGKSLFHPKNKILNKHLN